MASSSLEVKWVDFVKKLRGVGALLFFVFVPYLAFFIIPIQFILTLIAIRDIKNINQELNNSLLYNFYSKYQTATIVKFIGSIVVHLGAALMAAVITFGFPHLLPYNGLPPAIVLLIIGFIIMIIGSAVEVGAWDNLKFFIQDHKEMFPARSLYDTISSIENLRTGAFLWALGFLIIPIVIGWIFQLIGYFTLSNVAKWGMKLEPIIPKSQNFEPISTMPQIVQSTPISPPETELKNIIKFCPMCGAKISEGAIYCGECGVNLRS
jgi:uncharacterized membrane protein